MNIIRPISMDEFGLKQLYSGLYSLLVKHLGSH